MNKLFTLLLALAFSITAKAQFNKIEFHVAPIGQIQYSAKSPMRPLTDIGINYQQYMFKQTYISYGVQGITQKYNEDSKDTLNKYTGSLAYNQWRAQIGLRYLLREEVVYEYNYFIEGGFFYERIATYGAYKDGQYGDGINVYKRFKGVGLNLKLGAIYQNNSPWYFGGNIGLYFSGGKRGEISIYGEAPSEKPKFEETPVNANLFSAQLELRIGYRF